MKKMIALLLALVLCLSLAACGGESDPAPSSAGNGLDISGAAKDLNDTVDMLNEMRELINANLDVVPQELVDGMNSVIDTVEKYSEELQSSSLTQARLDELSAELAQLSETIGGLKGRVETAIKGLAEVKSYADIPVLAHITNILPVPEDLAYSHWVFAGGFVGDRDMNQEEYNAILELYGVIPDCYFETEMASMYREPDGLYGPYAIMEDGNTLVMELQGADGDIWKYVSIFTEVDGDIVMVMISGDDPSTALYMTPMGEDAG